MKKGTISEKLARSLEKLGVCQLEDSQKNEKASKEEKEPMGPVQKLLTKPSGSLVSDASVRGLMTSDGEKLSWVCEESFRVEAHGFIRDWGLGTIGLIHFLEDESEDEIRTLLESAAYLRHLLYEMNEVNRAPIAIEVTLVVLKWDETVAKVGNALRNITETSTFLHTIGISLLRAEEHANLNALRRAFPWLLHATRKWLQKSSGGGASGGKRRLKRLFLENFRVDGKRDWKFADGQNVHLVHGPNGSGKSSLVEAYEYLVTGKVERIERDHLASPDESVSRLERYCQVLKHRTTDGSQRVLAMGADFEEQDSLKITFEEEQALASGMPAGGFKLDQRFSNELIFGTQAERARLFLEHFFPGERKRIDDYREAREALSSWWEQAPEAMKSMFENVENIRLNPNRPRNEIPDDYFPKEMKNPEVRAVLAILLGKEGAYGHAEELSSELEEDPLDEAWRRLGKKLPGVEAKMSRIPEILMKLNEWEARESAQGENFKKEKTGGGDLLNGWLHHVALTDLLEKEYDVTRTLADLDDKEVLRGAPFVRPNERTLDRANRIKESLDEAKATRDGLQQALLSQKHRSRGGRVLEQVDLSVEDYEAIDWVADYFNVNGVDGGKVSEELKESLAQGRPVAFQSGESIRVTIGERAGVLGEWVGKAQDFASCLRLLQEQKTLFAVSPSEMHQVLDGLERALTTVREQDQGLIEKFTQKVNGELTEATNELMALMTPARWAYEDVEIRTKFSEEEEGVAFESGGMSAAIKLNTAELNTMTLALFLLTAVGRVDNPLSTIVLDDPFENMDELTTITVARCFARFQRLWRQVDPVKDWQMILLLHGAENFERVRDEVPCAAYFLPWLVPDGQKSEGEIKATGTRILEDEMLANFAE